MVMVLETDLFTRERVPVALFIYYKNLLSFTHIKKILTKFRNFSF